MTAVDNQPANRVTREIECLIARGFRTSQIVAQGYTYETVRAVRERLDRIAAPDLFGGAA